MNPNTKAGVFGGTIFSALLNISWDDIIFTIVMTSIGAIVSFIVSSLLHWAVKKLKS